MKLSRDTIKQARKAYRTSQPSSENHQSEERQPAMPFWEKPVLQERDRNRQNLRTIDVSPAAKMISQSVTISPKVKSPMNALQKHAKKVRKENEIH